MQRNTMENSCTSSCQRQQNTVKDLMRKLMQKLMWGAAKYHGKSHAKPHVRGRKISLSSFFIILDIMGDHKLGKSYKSFVVQMFLFIGSYPYGTFPHVNATRFREESWGGGLPWAPASPGLLQNQGNVLGISPGP